MRVVERAKPLLGTFVAIRVGGLVDNVAHGVLDRAFAAIAEIHQLMSFQDALSDISRLNREAHLRPMQVSAHTHEVLRCAAEISQRSEGVFDITVASHDGRWHDILLLSDDHVRFRRPLRIDVSGIAKGYAVDVATAILRQSGATRGCVNAGGDLAVFGAESERVFLQMPLEHEVHAPVVELRNESVATSGMRSKAVAEHVDGVDRRPAAARLASVIAPTCAIADALTKVVTARGAAARMTLQHFGAVALMSTEQAAWSEIS